MSLLYKDSSWNRYNNTSAANQVPAGDPLAIIYNEGPWRINQVTPLCNLKYNPVKLKLYAAKVRQALVGFLQAASVKYVVTFEEQPHLKFSEEDSSGLLITVSSVQENKHVKVAYAAILLSWGTSETLERAIHLPYMLERGEQKVGASVRSTLQALFDCNIRQLQFTQHHLLQFGFSFVENDSSRSTDPFTLSYKTPQADLKDKLNLAFEVGDITIILNGMKDEAANPSDLVSLTYKMLHNQIFSTLTLDVTALDLCEVNLHKAGVKSNGVIKMKTPEMVNCVFTVLNEIRYTEYSCSKVLDKCGIEDLESME